MLRTVSVILFAAAVACGGNDNGSSGNPSDNDAQPPQHTLQALVLTPANPVVQLDLNTAGSQAFAVTGTYADGVDEDLTASATLTLSDANVGTVSGTAVQIPAFTSLTTATAVVTATASGVSGTTSLVVAAYDPASDLFAVLPYQDPSGSVVVSVTADTSIKAMDVLFLVDTSASMAGEIGNLTSGLSTVMAAARVALANIQFGVASFQDFPVDGYGQVTGDADCTTQGDEPFRLLQSISGSSDDVVAAADAWLDGESPSGCGADLPDANIEALYQAATGDGLSGPTPTSVPANHAGLGGVGFRQGALPVIVDVTNAPSHGKDETGSCSAGAFAYDDSVSQYAHSRSDAKTSLANICARVIGIAALIGSDCTPLPFLDDMATATGALVTPAAWGTDDRPASCSPSECCTGSDDAGVSTDVNGNCPLAYESNAAGTGISSSVSVALPFLLTNVTYDFVGSDAAPFNDASGTAVATATFVQAIRPVSFHAARKRSQRCAESDRYSGRILRCHARYASDVRRRTNSTIAQADAPQIFHGTVGIALDGCLNVAQQNVIVLVPAAN